MSVEVIFVSPVPTRDIIHKKAKSKYSSLDPLDTLVITQELKVH